MYPNDSKQINPNKIISFIHSFLKYVVATTSDIHDILSESLNQSLFTTELLQYIHP